MKIEKVKTTQVALAIDVAIFNQVGQVLLGQRLAKAGYGTWAFSGGHVLDGEDLLAAARREIKEELGDNFQVDVSSEVVAVRDNCLPPYFIRHITIIVKGKHLDGEPLVNESDHCAEWGWFDLDNLPAPLFSGVEEALKSLTSGEVLVI